MSINSSRNSIFTAAPLKARDHHVVIGVDEAHADSLEAIQAALTFVDTSNPNANASLFSVVSKTSSATTSEDLKKRLEKTYKDIAENYQRQNPTAQPIVFHAISPFGNDSIATSLIKEANNRGATLIAIGAGSKISTGALGSVANEIVLRSSHAHVLIAKRMPIAAAAKFQQGKPRCFLIAIDGSSASREGLKELIVNLCKKDDCIRCVTVSDNSKDVAMVEGEIDLYKDIIAARGVNVTAEHVFRRNQTAAEVLCELSAEAAVGVGNEDGRHPPVNALVLGSSNGSSTVLGSCTKWCVGKCPISVIVMKITEAK